jgi:hypothetical protein
MLGFRAILLVIFSCLAIYTVIVIANHGWNLLPIFFGDIAAMTWPGQFNADFMGFLILSASWLAWSNNFSPLGICFAVCGFFGGIMFLAPYLFIMSFKCEGSIEQLLLGGRSA